MDRSLTYPAALLFLHVLLCSYLCTSEPTANPFLSHHPGKTLKLSISTSVSQNNFLDYYVAYLRDLPECISLIHVVILKEVCTLLPPQSQMHEPSHTFITAHCEPAFSTHP